MATPSDFHPQLPPDSPASWTELPYDQLLQLDRAEVKKSQLAALQRRFAQLKDKIKSLQVLAERQGVSKINDIADAVPLFFDHRVYKAYPLSLLEKRNFKMLTQWLDRLTTHDLSKLDLTGLTTVDGWLDRLDEFGMIIGHSTGTTGKLSFIPRSKTEWPAWANTYFECSKAATGQDARREEILSISTGYRRGHHMMAKMNRIFQEASLGGERNRITYHDGAVSSDLMSLAGRLQAAEEKGELDKLDIDPAILEARKDMIEEGRNKEQNLSEWFADIVAKNKGRKVKMGGTYAELYRLAVGGMEMGIKCEFAPGSILVGGGGMKGYKDAPDNWAEIIKAFFGIDKLCSMYGMSELMPLSPLCPEGHFHIPPYLIPVILDDEFKPLPEEGTQVGRFAAFDLLAETYWGGFISSDKVTMHWDGDCKCGWGGPRIEKNIVRFSELEGGDDKITCAGSSKAYSEFMNYVQNI